MSWSNKYKRSIDCDSPKGFSQRAHCAARKKRAKGGETKSKSPFNEMHEIKTHKTVEQIAKKHRLEVSFVKHQLKMGIPIEHEHTKDKDLATDIALQHLDEIPDYYTRLKKMESDAKKEHKKFKDVKEHCGCEDNAVEELETGLKKLDDTSYSSIDKLMRRIMKKHDMTAKQLHNAFVDKNDKTPDDWIKQINEEGLRDWFGKSKSKDGKSGWVNVVTGGTCASDEPGEGVPKCVSSAKRASMTKAERLSAARRKKKADPGQQQKTGAAKPTYVSTDSPRKKMKEEMDLNLQETSDKPGKGSGKKDACYHKVKSRYRVWPSAYASGALVKCRKVGAQNWGTASEAVEEKKYCKLCRKTETKSECQFGPEMWEKYTVAKKWDPNRPHPGNMPESFEINREKHTEGRQKSAAKKIRQMSTAQQAQLPKEMVKKVVGTDLPRFNRESISIEDADGNHYAEFIDIIKPEPLKPSKGIGSDMLDEAGQKCWPGYKKKGTQKLFGKTYNRCVKAEEFSLDEVKGHGGSPGQEYIDPMKGKTFSPAPKDLRKMFINGPRGSVGQDPKNSPGNTNSATSESKKTFGQFMTEANSVNEDWQKVNRQDKTDGLSPAAVKAYRRENPGSKLQTAVTEKKPKGKRAKRRASFCRRMKGMKSKLTSAKTARDPDSRINKALRRWRCR